MEALYHRSFNVDYYEKDAQTWEIVSQLTDEHHDIIVSLDVQVPEMIIRDAVIQFNRCPLTECHAVEQKASELIGLNILRDYRQRIMPLVLGPQGCPNLMHLLGISVPGIEYFYAPHQIKTGKKNVDSWMNELKEHHANDCLAHSICFEKK